MILPNKHLEFKKWVRAFAQKEILPTAAQRDRTEEFPWDPVRKMAQAGLFGIWVPKKYGGQGLDTLTYTIAIEEISRVCASTGVTLAAHSSLPCGLLFHHGSEAQKKKYLVPMVRGKKMGGFGLTEPQSGSDAAAMKTRAIKKGNKWIVNGTKMFTTNGSTADVLLIAAVTNPSQGRHGISAFVVEKSFPGFQVSKKLHKMGWRASDTCELIFDNCEVPLQNLIGKEGEGFKYFLKALDGGRIGVGAMAVGIAQGALDECVKAVKADARVAVTEVEYEQVLLEIGQWPGPLKKQQGMEFLLADMEAGITVARNMVYTAAQLRDQGLPFKKEAAIAKLVSTETGMRICTQAMDVLAPNAATEELPLSRFFRDIKACEIGEGTSQVQRMVIVRALFHDSF